MRSRSAWELARGSGLWCCRRIRRRHACAPPVASLSTRAAGPLASQGADSDTPLHLAALYGHAECVRLLLERGARADVADSDGEVGPASRPACLSAQRRRFLMADCRWQVKQSPGLLLAPAGALPLHDAAAGGYASICEMLLDAAPGCIDRGDSEGAQGAVPRGHAALSTSRRTRQWHGPPVPATWSNYCRMSHPSAPLHTSSPAACFTFHCTHHCTRRCRRHGPPQCCTRAARGGGAAAAGPRGRCNVAE